MCFSRQCPGGLQEGETHEEYMERLCSKLAQNERIKGPSSKSGRKRMSIRRKRKRQLVAIHYCHWCCLLDFVHHVLLSIGLAL